MSAIQQLKEQLHQISTEANRAAGGLAGFQQGFSQKGMQVQALIAGTATSTDRDIIELLDAAGRAVGEAVEALQQAAAGCASYANQI